MADMVVSFVVEQTLSRICTLVNEEIKLIRGFGHEFAYCFLLMNLHLRNYLDNGYKASTYTIRM